MNNQKELAEAVKLLSLAAKAMQHAAEKVVAVQRELNKPDLKIIDKEK